MKREHGFPAGHPFPVPSSTPHEEDRHLAATYLGTASVRSQAILRGERQLSIHPQSRSGSRKTVSLPACRARFPRRSSESTGCRETSTIRRLRDPAPRPPWFPSGFPPVQGLTTPWS